MYLLDTNVISETRKTKTNKIDANVEAWWTRAKLPVFFISVITLFEIEEGILRMERRDVVQGASRDVGWNISFCPRSKGAPCPSRQ